MKRLRTSACGAVVGLILLLALPSVGHGQTDEPDSTVVLLRRPAAAIAPLSPRPAHARSGGPAPIIFGDSADHTKHNIIGVATVSSASMVILWVLPERITLWRRERTPLETLRMTYTMPPRWDTDPWAFNYILHPVAGMQAYLLERNWGRSPVRSFLFATGASVAWEYGFEAVMERPSIQDLLITSPAGAVLGEASYRLTQRLRRDGFTNLERVVMVVVNPAYLLQHGW